MSDKFSLYALAYTKDAWKEVEQTLEFNFHKGNRTVGIDVSPSEIERAMKLTEITEYSFVYHPQLAFLKLLVDYSKKRGITIIPLESNRLAGIKTRLEQQPFISAKQKEQAKKLNRAEGFLEKSIIENVRKHNPEVVIVSAIRAGMFEGIPHRTATNHSPRLENLFPWWKQKMDRLRAARVERAKIDAGKAEKKFARQALQRGHKR